VARLPVSVVGFVIGLLGLSLLLFACHCSPVAGWLSSGSLLVIAQLVGLLLLVCFGSGCHWLLARSLFRQFARRRFIVISWLLVAVVINCLLIIGLFVGCCHYWLVARFTAGCCRFSA
jgi:hypothetical protein